MPQQGLPAPVEAWIEENRTHPEHLAHAELIGRLANDPDVLGLLRELQRRKPRGWVHTVSRDALAHLCDPSGMSPDECQEIALACLFKQLLHIAVSLHPARTEADTVEAIEDCQRRAKWLRTEADDTERLRPGAGGVDWTQVAAGMRAKADVLEQAAAEYRRFTAVVHNARDNLTGLQTASRISAILKVLYGKAMERASADIAQALTGERVTHEQVREINRKQPATVKFLRERPKNSQVETSPRKS